MPNLKKVHSLWFTVHRKTINHKPSTINWRQRRHGFTLIELLVVISIIGILASLGTYSYTNAQARSRDSRRKADLDAIKKASTLFYQDNNAYPCFGTPVSSCIAADTFGWAPPAGSQIQTYLVPTYTAQMPIDPKGNNVCSLTNPPYLFSGAPNSSVFTIYAMLENTNDSDATAVKPTPKGIPTGSTTLDGYKTFTIGSGSCNQVRYNYWVNNP